MVFITEELIRKKSEHNEGIIGTLEELSLHQEDVEKIEHIHNWSKGLTILYLQANLIPRIENLNKLKNLQYLNLAINNIEKIENLERCEYLEKLDLTLNFIGDIQSVRSLRNNIHLRQLYLTGNPCTDYKNYRPYVIANLPQLANLDNVEISRSERIKALQILDEIEPNILLDEKIYQQKRLEQKMRLENEPTELDDDAFWKSKCEHAPETRIEMSRRVRKNKNLNPEEVPVKTVKLFTNDGRPLNMNQARLPFKFDDSDDKQYVLDLGIYKHLDTTLLDVDIQPIYVKVLIKTKVFQFVLPEEISPDKSLVQRSRTTGHLVITMPKSNYVPKKHISVKTEVEDARKLENRQFLDVPSKNDDMDFSKIIDRHEKIKHFVDNPDVPPLEFA